MYGASCGALGEIRGSISVALRYSKQGPGLSIDKEMSVTANFRGKTRASVIGSSCKVR